jgi:hypothetical protein
MPALYSNRGRGQVGDKRTHCVSVRLSPTELSLLDDRRGRNQRGSYLRACLLDKLPPVIPQVNLSLHRDLGRALGNLSTISVAMRGGKYVELPEVLQAVRDLRLRLIVGQTEAQISYSQDDEVGE